MFLFSFLLTIYLEFSFYDCLPWMGYRWPTSLFVLLFMCVVFPIVLIPDKDPNSRWKRFVLQVWNALFLHLTHTSVLPSYFGLADHKAVHKVALILSTPEKGEHIPDFFFPAALYAKILHSPITFCVSIIFPFSPDLALQSPAFQIYSKDDKLKEVHSGRL